MSEETAEDLSKGRCSSTVRARKGPRTRSFTVQGPSPPGSRDQELRVKETGVSPDLPALTRGGANVGLSQQRSWRRVLVPLALSPLGFLLETQAAQAHR